MVTNPELEVVLGRVSVIAEDETTGDEVYRISGTFPRADAPQILRDLADLLETDEL